MIYGGVVGDKDRTPAAKAARAFFVIRFFLPRLAAGAASPPPLVSGAARFLPLPLLPPPAFWPLPEVDATGSGSALKH